MLQMTYSQGGSKSYLEVILVVRDSQANTSKRWEEQVFPAAYAVGLLVIAFTCTRWGSLLKGHPQWHLPAPTAADYYRYALHNPAVQVALTAESDFEPVTVKPVCIKCFTFGERRD